MNIDYAADYLPVIQALAERKTCQLKNNKGTWDDLKPGAKLDFSEPANNYRVKPERRTWWICFVYSEKFPRLVTCDEKSAREFLETWARVTSTARCIETIESPDQQ